MADHLFPLLFVDWKYRFKDETIKLNNIRPVSQVTGDIPLNVYQNV